MSSDRRSISGYAFKLCNESSLISWKTRKQSIVALSTCEAEYVALATATQEAKFLRQLLADLMSGAPNDRFFSNAFRRCFRFSGVLLKLYRSMLGWAKKYLSVRIF